MSLLRLEKVVVDYGSIHALKEIDIDVNTGEVITLIGANGAGKSTTMKAIMGLIPVKSGKIWFDGFIKPRLDAEERRHFRHAAADGRRVIAEGFEAERQLVPDLVSDDLVFGALLDKADFFSLFALGQFVEILSVKQNFSGTSAMRREDGFELPEQR